MEEDKQLRASSLEDDGELLQYDFCKHLRSLAIFVLGGVLIVAKDFDPNDVKPTSILIAMALVALGGVCSFASSSEIVRAKSDGTKPKRSQKVLMKVGAGMLATGTGLFHGIVRRQPDVILAPHFTVRFPPIRDISGLGPFPPIADIRLVCFRPIAHAGSCLVVHQSRVQARSFAVSRACV